MADNGVLVAGPPGPELKWRRAEAGVGAGAHGPVCDCVPTSVSNLKQPPLPRSKRRRGQCLCRMLRTHPLPLVRQRYAAPGQP